MSGPNEVAWQAAVNAAGTTPARMLEGERLLASVGDEALPTELVDKLVAQAIAARTTPAARTGRKPAYRVMAAFALLVAMAAVGPQWIWPERTASLLRLDARTALIQAMTDADEAARLEAVAVLDEHIAQAIKVLSDLTADPQPQLARTAASGLEDMRSAILRLTSLDEAGQDLAKQPQLAMPPASGLAHMRSASLRLASLDEAGQDLAKLLTRACDPDSSTGDRSLAAQQIANWGEVAIYAMRSAVLTGAQAGKERDQCLDSLQKMLTKK